RGISMSKVSKQNSVVQPSLSEYTSKWLKRVRAGDIGSLPIIFGIVVIAAIFGYLSDGIVFRERNFVNLLLQMSGLAAISIGVVFVLLIAEIDLSMAYVSGVGGVIMTLLLREAESNWPWWGAIGAALIVCTMIGLLHGLIITKAGVPSFVVTLAGLLAGSGVVLIMTTIFSNAGTIVIQDKVVLGIANSYLPAKVGWGVASVLVIAYGLTQFVQFQSKRQQNLITKPVSLLVMQVIGVALIAGFVVWFANRDRGVPTSAMIIMSFLGIWSFVANRTKFGRYIYAVGGNPEAARRAAIDVDRIRIAAFMIASIMAGVGGIILASRLRSVDTNTGGGNLL
ncbi:MAG: hypothetical protein KAG66_18220, partial [Methylococcales bacterium]|nr:hypothetical protein [Methylococcales bacterium]